MRFFRILSLFALAMSTACGGEDPMLPTPPPPTVDDPVYGIQLLVDQSHELAVGDSLSFRARYVDDRGSPITDGTVSFALVGQANDATLSRTDALTDENGIVSGTLFASSMPTTFQVRLNAQYAAPVSLAIAVSDAGFGTIVTEIVDESEVPVSRWLVGLFRDEPCSSEMLEARGERFRTLPAGETSLELRVPATVVYSIVARGESASGELRAFGCVEDIQLDSDEVKEVAIVATVAPLRAEGTYEGELGFVTMETPRDTFDALLEGYEGSDAALLLDAIEAGLRDDLREEWAARREALEAEWREHLPGAPGLVVGEPGMGPTLALAQWAQEMAVQIAQIDVDISVTILEDIQVQMLGVRLQGADGEEISLEPSSRGTIGASLSSDRSTILVDRLSLNVSLAEAIEAIAESSWSGDAPSLRSHLVEQGACEDLEPPPALADFCDAECLENTCLETVQSLAADTMERIWALDSVRSGLNLEGEIALSDIDANRQADDGAGELFGSWSGTGRTEEIEANISLSRMVFEAAEAHERRE